jgi:hypothetical protein
MYFILKKPKILVPAILRIIVTVIIALLSIPAAGTCFSSSHHLKSSDTKSGSSKRKNKIITTNFGSFRTQYVKPILNRYGFKTIFKICSSIGPSERQTWQYIAAPQHDARRAHTGNDARLDSISPSMYYGLCIGKQCFEVESHQ